jgi:hypothetical protein
VTAGDVIVVALQAPSGGSVGVHDKYYSGYSGVSTGGGTSEAVGVFYVTALGSGSYTDTITATDTVSGLIALEAFDVSGMPSGWTPVISSASCTSSCPTVLTTSSLYFAQRAFLIASAFASPGSSTSTQGSGFDPLHFGTYNALRAAEVGKSTPSSGVSDPSSFPMNDGASPTSWVEVGAAIEEPAFASTQGSLTVPAAPSNTNGFACSFPCTTFQNEAIWNGLVDPSTNYIVQPILVYGCYGRDFYGGNCVDGGNLWTITSWADGFPGGPYFSRPLTVSVGDGISESVSYFSSSNPSICSGSGPFYAIHTIDNTPTTRDTQLNFCTTDGFPNNVGGELEVNNVGSCNQLPNVSSMTISGLYSTTLNGGTITYLPTGDPNFCYLTSSWSSNHDSVTMQWIHS